ncbi:MAG: hypothetical protein FJ224_03895 [Lentisphaerae bacterium]|nr:hypothetical protein [Lentisphaerota bacterium]
MKTGLLAVVALLLPAFCACGQDDGVFRVYPLNGGDEIVQILRDVAGPEARIVPDPQSRRLMVYAGTNAHARIASVLLEADQPRKNIRIDVVFVETAQDTAAGAGVGGSGHVVITPSGAGGTVKITPRFYNRATGVDSTSVQTLMVQSGGEGRLEVGSEIPHVEWLTDYGARHGLLSAETSWRRVGAFLRVRATVVGDGSAVRLELTPEMSGLTDAGDQSVRFSGVSTEMTVRNGSTVDIGGFEQNRDFYSRFLVGFDRGGTARKLSIRVTPRILDN